MNHSPEKPRTQRDVALWLVFAERFFHLKQLSSPVLFRLPLCLASSRWCPEDKQPCLGAAPPLCPGRSLSQHHTLQVVHSSPQSAIFVKQTEMLEVWAGETNSQECTFHSCILQLACPSSFVLQLACPANVVSACRVQTAWKLMSVLNSDLSHLFSSSTPRPYPITNSWLLSYVQ